MVVVSRRGELTRQKKKQPWSVHQRLAWTVQGRCCWAKCPGIEKSKAKTKCSYATFMCCEECSAMAGFYIYLCNGNKGDKVVFYHVTYHKLNHNKVFLLDTH